MKCLEMCEDFLGVKKDVQVQVSYHTLLGEGFTSFGNRSGKGPSGGVLFLLLTVSRASGDYLRYLTGVWS